MPIVKTVSFRKNLKTLLKDAKSGKEELYLDYYDQLFQVVPVNGDIVSGSQVSKIINKYVSRSAQPSLNQILNEQDPTTEKANIRNLKHSN